jgi:orotate phosphoribosyltransferase
MASNRRVSEILVESGAYKDLDVPVILTSGLIGIYYINTEKVLRDGGEWERVIKQSPGDSIPVIWHAIRRMQAEPTFGELIDILATECKNNEPKAVSGGERRDWLFSGPVAHRLGIPHLSLFKDGNKSQLILETPLPNNTSVVHVSDLLTAGSSAYDPRYDPPRGWIPQIRSLGLRVSDLHVVVTRYQGGEEALRSAGVDAHPLVGINKEFLTEHSRYPQRALDYLEHGALDWGCGYIVNKGIDVFVDAFSPEKTAKDARAKKFLQVYRTALMMGRGEELAEKVREKYNIDINNI